MNEIIAPSDVYDKNLNFLVGAGASSGLFPTLALKIKNIEGKAWSLEDLATYFESIGDPRLVPLFMHYYASCIQPAQEFKLELKKTEEEQEVIRNYRDFLETVLKMLPRRNSLERHCNIFTTNYDGCIPLVADEIVREGNVDFLLNDGARGFSRRYLQARNFNTYLCQTGIFERHQISIPQINLIHLHGSVYWKKERSSIVVDYLNGAACNLLDEKQLNKLKPFSECLENEHASLDHLEFPDLKKEELDDFWLSYKKLPIVNPTKWKFHETVFDEHYYQMLRMLSYELEKPNAVLITFGFSFADEHILNLVKRSLSNPRLQVYICCYNKWTQESLKAEFRGYNNVRCIVLNDGDMDFTAFNNKVFTLDELSPVKAAEGSAKYKSASMNAEDEV